ncbi:hypothetical protein EMIHUDRAFT_120221 [Emiliania huxleyi CCMP1516]|uniref:Fatty acid desaturase domain-containing protein n=2 Tax=Emiliania huxleyi TaxID=2903 RepID=A0A0D3IL46_EMIH1|nr:hypothetical protein EMIHUDRAFT_120221 [Emiliania huxleyi CCMP1516]EOD11981.1 hypothetical protein EMIHUDRAFT_120221 [Emiliania huxleyi CCMP1516]|eukprot:XP_005764410.1 hypothetical protein EMIHUDRAFT_120221 [Emiliania huxleyi CCMP1516]
MDTVRVAAESSCSRATALAAAKSAASLVFTACWYYKCGRALLYAPHHVAASLVSVIVIRWYHRRTAAPATLVAVAREELRGIASDWTAPLANCARAHAVSWKRLYVDLCASASALPSYANLGPLGLGRMIHGSMWLPAMQVADAGHALLIFSRHSDGKEDPHSPVQCGVAYAYLGWLFDRHNFRTRVEHMRDWQADAPELFALELLAAGEAQDVVDATLLRPARALAAWWFVDPTDFVVHRFGDMARDAASAGGAFAVQMNLLFNAYAHDEHRADHAGRGGAAWDIPARWFGLLSSGEAHHARHHLHPTLACNSPHGAQEDWVFGAILLLERCGLVWEVRRRPKTE